MIEGLTGIMQIFLAGFNAWYNVEIPFSGNMTVSIGNLTLACISFIIIVMILINAIRK